MKNTKSTIPNRLARLQEMKAMREAGKTLAEIGAKYGVSRERVRQLIGNTGRINFIQKGEMT